MAWPKHVQQVVELLDEGIYDIVLVRGYLEARANQGDTLAAQHAGRLEGVQKLFRLIRIQQWKQLGLWPGGDDGEQG